MDKEQLVSVRDVMTLDDVARDATARHRFRAVLVTAFAGLALLLAMVGLFGVLGLFGAAAGARLRRAPRARRHDRRRAAARGRQRRRRDRGGVVIGLALSMMLGRLLTTMLFGVQPLDPATFVLVAVVLLLTAAASTIGPAWRATRIDPAVALRSE